MIRCFYHAADLDGQCSGAIVKYKFPDAVMYPINYGDEFPWDEIQQEDVVYMVDFCLQPFEEMVRLDKSHRLYWIDHHSSAISQAMLANESGDFVPAALYVRTSVAACELTWEYLFPDRPVPLAVKLISLYDSWTYQRHELEEMVLAFQIRLRMEDLDPKDWNLVKQQLFVQDDDVTVGDYWAWLFFPTVYKSIEFIDFVNEGRLLLRHDQAQKDKYAQTYAFETTITPPTPAGSRLDPLLIKLDATAINLGHTNSKVFDSVWRRPCLHCNGEPVLPIYTSDHKPAGLVCAHCDGRGWVEPYDLMITFCRRSDKLWNVSLYSTKDNVDCGVIAKSFGGGGHKGAAGFQCGELPFDY